MIAAGCARLSHEARNVGYVVLAIGVDLHRVREPGALRRAKAASTATPLPRSPADVQRGSQPGPKRSRVG